MSDKKYFCEDWVDIEGYEGLYKVSSHGRVLSVDRVIRKKDGKKLTVREKVLKQSLDSSGYPIISLNKNGKSITRNVHRIVCESFMGNEIGLDVNHKDLNKENNRIENLEWCTRKENVNHFYKNTNVNRSGDNARNRKLTHKKVCEIREALARDCSKKSKKSLCEKYNVSLSTIMAIKSRRNWNV